MRPLVKGILLCLLGVALNATSNVVTKEVMQAVPFLMVALLWFGGASVWFCVCALCRKQNPFPWFTRYWKAGVSIGLMNYLAAVTWFYAIDKIGPLNHRILPAIGNSAHAAARRHPPA